MNHCTLLEIEINPLCEDEIKPLLAGPCLAIAAKLDNGSSWRFEKLYKLFCTQDTENRGAEPKKMRSSRGNKSKGIFSYKIPFFRGKFSQKELSPFSLYLFIFSARASTIGMEAIIHRRSIALLVLS